MDRLTGPTPTLPLDVLVSYHYARDADMGALTGDGRLRIIADSGAFSALTLGAPIDLRAYAGWCRRWWDAFCWVAGLDVIGDPVATQVNWLRMRDEFGLLTVPTLHSGAHTSWLDFYAGQGVDLVGLGGMAGRGQATRAYRWAVHLFAYAATRWPAVRFHLWGVTRWAYLVNLPAWSADSSGVLTRGCRFGRLKVFDPARAVRLDVFLNGTGDTRRAGRVLRTVYGVDPATIDKSTGSNRHLIVRAGALIAQQEAAWLQARHRVSAPGMFRTDTPTVGPLIHAAETDPRTFGMIHGGPLQPQRS